MKWHWKTIDWKQIRQNNILTYIRHTFNGACDETIRLEIRITRLANRDIN